MVPAQALWHAGPERFLAGHPAENPVALQLGGSKPKHIAHGARLGEQWGYDEINLNVGCPSDRVQSGRFGACLMKEPALVAELVTAMRESTDLPVTVKSRIGVDDHDDYEHLQTFVEAISAAGVDALIVHARKAWLKGLSPKQNREVPPLRYDRVEQLKADFPDLPMVVNGGIQSLAEAKDWLGRVDGVMIGREAYHNPWLLAEADGEIFERPRESAPQREAVIRAYQEFIAERLEPGVPISRYTRHMIGLYQGLPGAKIWRRSLSEGAARKGAGVEIIDQALEARSSAISRLADYAE